MIPEQPTVTLMAHSLQAVIMDLKDKVGVDRSWKELQHFSTWGSGTEKKALGGCKGYAVWEA